mmetsp:Transcript_4587/g.19678  ORF Transcript_4587/g.19678 Transcript_4587/m.19678 type:complete len:131 (+) Transcript_4587:5917-6309(+)
MCYVALVETERDLCLFADSSKVRAFSTIEKLSPASETEATMTCVITTGRPEAIPIRVSSSVGSCDGEMRPTPGEILRPDTSLTLGQFMTLEQQLGGTFPNEADVEVQTTPAFAWQVRIEPGDKNLIGCLD